MFIQPAGGVFDEKGEGGGANDRPVRGQRALTTDRLRLTCALIATVSPFYMFRVSSSSQPLKWSRVGSRTPISTLDQTCLLLLYRNDYLRGLSSATHPNRSPIRLYAIPRNLRVRPDALRMHRREELAAERKECLCTFPPNRPLPRQGSTASSPPVTPPAHDPACTDLAALPRAAFLPLADGPTPKAGRPRGAELPSI